MVISPLPTPDVALSATYRRAHSPLTRHADTASAPATTTRRAPARCSRSIVPPSADSLSVAGTESGWGMPSAEPERSGLIADGGEPTAPSPIAQEQTSHSDSTRQIVEMSIVVIQYLFTTVRIRAASGNSIGGCASRTGIPAKSLGHPLSLPLAGAASWTSKLGDGRYRRAAFESPGAWF